MIDIITDRTERVLINLSYSNYFSRQIAYTWLEFHSLISFDQIELNSNVNSNTWWWHQCCCCWWTCADDIFSLTSITDVRPQAIKEKLLTMTPESIKHRVRCFKLSCLNESMFILNNWHVHILQHQMDYFWGVKSCIFLWLFTAFMIHSFFSEWFYLKPKKIGGQIILIIKLAVFLAYKQHVT